MNQIPSNNIDFQPDWSTELPLCRSACPLYEEGKCKAMGGSRVATGTVCSPWAAQALGVARCYLQELRNVTPKAYEHPWVQRVAQVCNGLDSRQALEIQAQKLARKYMSTVREAMAAAGKLLARVPLANRAIKPSGSGAMVGATQSTWTPNIEGDA